MSIPSYEQAKAAENQTFSLVLADGAPVSLNLSEVKSQGSGHDFPGKRQEPYSLYFVGAQGCPCPQGTYTLRNDNVGEWELFIVPIAFDHATGAYTFQALINN